MPFDCFTGDGKVVFHKAGSFTPFPTSSTSTTMELCRRPSEQSRRWQVTKLRARHMSAKCIPNHCHRTEQSRRRDRYAAEATALLL